MLVHDSLESSGTKTLHFQGRVVSKGSTTSRHPTTLAIAEYLALPNLDDSPLLNNVEVLDLSGAHINPRDMDCVCTMVERLPACSVLVLANCPFLELILAKHMNALIAMERLKTIVLCGSPCISILGVNQFSQFGESHLAKLVFLAPYQLEIPEAYNYLVRDPELQKVVQSTHRAFFKSPHCPAALKLSSAASTAAQPVTCRTLDIQHHTVEPSAHTVTDLPVVGPVVAPNVSPPLHVRSRPSIPDPIPTAVLPTA